MTYQIKEIFYSLQGEGFHTGRPAIFCRFSNCNLWTGREEDRNKAICQFCDTDFLGTDGKNGGRYTATQLAEKLLEIWPTTSKNTPLPPYPFAVLTGGEPLLQLDQDLVNELKKHKIELALETNGTKIPPKNIDWICVSPKAGAEWKLLEGDELKLVYPQADLMPSSLKDKTQGFKNLYLQPMDNANQAQNTKNALEFCLKNPEWKLSLQTHKILEIE